MCQYSTIMNNKYNEWQERYWTQPPILPYTLPEPLASPKPTEEELEQFRRDLEAAKQQDTNLGTPDCEDANKKKLLKEMAEALGVEISFP